MHYRKATPADAPLLADLRKRQLVDEGITPDTDINEALLSFISRTLEDNSMVEWIVFEADIPVATAAIVFYAFPPTYTNPTGWKGYITNMYTAPQFRGQGLATSLLARLVAEAQARGVRKLWLGASKLGKPVYLKYGFQGTDEWMEMTLPGISSNPI